MQEYLKIALIAGVIGALVGSGMSALFLRTEAPAPTNEERIAEYYATENAVHVSPHSLRKKMDKNDQSYILVDLRSAQEYETSHIVGAINIPAYSDPNTSAYDEKDRIISAFDALPDGKDIIVYCYSTPCMTGRKVGQMLAEHQIYVKHLNIGWNEWRYYWDLWNHDGETPTKGEDYIVSGKEPGTPNMTDWPSPCGEGELGC